MAQMCTTSIRMDEQLAHRLEDAATKLHRRIQRDLFICESAIKGILCILKLVFTA